MIMFGTRPFRQWEKRLLSFIEIGLTFTFELFEIEGLFWSKLLVGKSMGPSKKSVLSWNNGCLEEGNGETLFELNSCRFFGAGWVLKHVWFLFRDTDFLLRNNVIAGTGLWLIVIASRILIFLPFFWFFTIYLDMPYPFEERELFFG